MQQKWNQNFDGELMPDIPQKFLNAGCDVYMVMQLRHDEKILDERFASIQPLWGTVKVSGDCDTEVVFTDVETGEKYRIGYITQGVTERIKLERGKWYKVAGGGNLTLNPVNIRVE